MRKILRIRHIILYPFKKIHNLLKFKRKYNIISEDNFFDLITYKKKSISRYGDGEISIMEGDSKIRFQSDDNKLRERLIEVSQLNNKNLIIGIPRTLNTMKRLRFGAKFFWVNNLYLNYDNWIKYFKQEGVYFDSLVTRPYIINKKTNSIVFDKWRSVFNDRDLVVIEGDKTRFGVNNDLLSSAKSIKRVLVPSENAFLKYKEIIEFCLTLDKNSLFILAIGPTATILSSDLSIKGFQAIDIGHLDLEYEWFIRNARKKINIPGKYTNESSIYYTEYKYSEDIEESYNKSIVMKIK